MKNESSLFNYWIKYVDPLRKRMDELSEKIIKRGIFANPRDRFELKKVTKIYNTKIDWIEEMLDKDPGL